MCKHGTLGALCFPPNDRGSARPPKLTTNVLFRGAFDDFTSRADQLCLRICELNDSH